MLRRFSGPELRKRVEEALSERAETKKVQDQEEEEEEPADPGSEPDFDPPESPIGSPMADPAQLSQQREGLRARSRSSKP